MLRVSGITDNYFVIVEQPLCISIPRVLISKIKNDPMVGNLRWYQDKMVYFLTVIIHRLLLKIFYYFPDSNTHNK